MRKFKLGLLVSAAALSSCATNLASRTPIDIASNSVRRTDALSGVSEVIAPRVTVFAGRGSSVRGQAQFRTAGPFTDDKGKVHTGGAYLDISIKYTSATPNPAEARMYDQANWPGGQPALIADYGASVLDCREDVRAVPQYTPIYGALGYGHIHDDYCGHEYGHRGWGHGYGYYGHGHVHDDTCGHDVDHDGDTVVVQPTTDPRPDRPHRPRRRPGDVVPHPDGPGTDPTIGPDVRPRTGPNDPVTRPRIISHTTKRAVSRPRPDITPGGLPDTVSRPRPAVQPKSPVVSRPAPVSKPVSKPVARPVSRPNPVSRPKPVSKPKSTYKPKPSSKPVVRRPRSNTSTNIRRQMNYYPRDPYYNYGPTDYVVRRSCDRQENLRVFVPRGRLDAAEARGLVLYVMPRGGREEMLVLPPNYISGFKLAAWLPEGERLTLPGKAVRPVQAAQTPTPYKAKPDPNKPIIYGEN